LAGACSIAREGVGLKLAALDMREGESVAL